MLLCQCPKLSPLQSRFLASLLTLGILGLIYWSLSHPHFAYAAELELDGSGRSRDGEDHNWHRIADQIVDDDGVDMGDLGEGDGADTLARRVQDALTIGGNDVANNENIQPGKTTLWMYSKDQLQSKHAPRGKGLPENVQDEIDAEERHVELRKRYVVEDDELSDLEERQNGNSRLIYVSINTCLQPSFVGTGVQSAPPPQLTLYVSNTASNTNPGPDGDPNNQREITLGEGFARTSLRASGDWYISVHAPSISNDFTGVWNYELAVSIDDYFHSFEGDSPNLFLLDSDSTAALLVTNNLTQANASSTSYKEWLKLTAPYVVFASNVNDTSTMGISHSFCGLNKNSQIFGKQDDPSGDTTGVQMEMITRGLGGKPKEQFYVRNLNSSSDYHATLALVGNSTTSGDGVVGGGGKVWKRAHFSTKTDGNCALLYNLTFCNEVAYAVPSTPDFIADFSKFQQFYDNYTRHYYQNFNYSLQQIPCRTVPDAQYSLARNCDDCAKAYKDWLCAVSIPRCEDFSNNATYLQTRNVGQKFYNGSSLSDEFLTQKYIPMPNAPTLEGSIAHQQTYISSLATNSSRNPKIDEVIAPGPYKEVLPCEDLCYGLVQSCPAALGFGCPFPGRGLEAGYGTRHGNGNGTLTCSFLGAYVYTGGAGGLGSQVSAALAMAILVGMALS